MTPADYARMAEACGEAALRLRTESSTPVDANDPEVVALRQAADFFAALSSSSAEDAAGAARELEARARVAADGAKVQERSGNGLGFDLLDREAALLGRAASLLRASSAAVAEAVRVAVEKEREECAKECDAYIAAEAASPRDVMPGEVSPRAYRMQAAANIARRIRARSARVASGEKEGA